MPPAGHPGFVGWTDLAAKMNVKVSSIKKSGFDPLSFCFHGQVPTGPTWRGSPREGQGCNA
jgi:hypothetical protein